MRTISPATGQLAGGAAQAAAACAIFGIAFYLALDIPDAARPAATPLPALPVAPAPRDTAPAPVQHAAPDAQGIILYGVSDGGARGRAAILGSAAGGQRLVPVGKAYRAGLVVAEVGIDHAVLRSAAGDVRLTLDRRQTASAAGRTATTAAASGAVALAAIGPAGVQAGFAPHRADGRIDGFAVKPSAALPFLAEAGLQAGDVITTVNGQNFDSHEKLIDLPREIAGSYTAEFEFIRDGKRMKATLPVNKKPSM
jgi:S1-C subfamily serine protease